VPASFLTLQCPILTSCPAPVPVPARSALVELDRQVDDLVREGKVPTAFALPVSRSILESRDFSPTCSVASAVALPASPRSCRRESVPALAGDWTEIWASVVSRSNSVVAVVESRSLLVYAASVTPVAGLVAGRVLQAFEPVPDRTRLSFD
jgi:hypothetical protein